MGGKHALYSEIGGGGGGTSLPADAAGWLHDNGTGTLAWTTPTASDVGAQPVDSDLTAIAALTTTAFGRSLLEAANAAGLRTLAGLGTAATSASTDFQPVDSDLTAIAALTTTSYGRSLLEAANAAALRTLAGLGNVDNTSDASKPISTATQAALDLKAPLASPALTGTPTVNGVPIGGTLDGGSASSTATLTVDGGSA